MAQFNVNLAFNADTGKAKTQIMELQSLLSKITYAGTASGTDKLQTDLHAASEAAKELQFHLNNAFNASTGNFDLSMLDRSLKTSGSNVTDLSVKLLSAGATGQQAFVKLAQSISLADQPMFRISKRMQEFAVTMKNTVKWQLSSSMLHGFMGAVQSAYGYAKDLNKSLNDIRIVTGYNTDKMAEFAEQANKAAKALSTTTTDYTNASLIYFQQGLSDAEVAARTDITVKMANAVGQSAEVISEQLTAVWNNFDDGSKSLEYYADVMTALGAATASSSDEISEGLSKFAAVAGSVGLSYEYATSALATLTSNTRESADVVGNSLKTLFARIQGLTLGETLDDGTDLNKYSQALEKVGISIYDANGGLKDMDNILDEMAAKWNTLSDTQQVALAQTVAGVRQYNQLIALMENWNNGDSDSMMANLNTVAGSEGALQKQADIYAESWEAAEKRAQAAAEGIYQSLLDDKFFITLTNGFTNLLTGLDAFIEGAGGVKTVLMGIGSIIMTVFANKIPSALQTLKYNFQVLTKGSQEAYATIQKDMQEATKIAFTEGGIDQNSAMGFAITQANKLTEAKNRLAKVSDQMSEKARQEAHVTLSLAEALQEEAVALKQKNDELQKTVKTSLSQTIEPNSDFGYQQGKVAQKAMMQSYTGTSFGVDPTNLNILEEAAMNAAESIRMQLVPQLEKAKASTDGLKDSEQLLFNLFQEDNGNVFTSAFDDLTSSMGNLLQNTNTTKENLDSAREKLGHLTEGTEEFKQMTADVAGLQQQSDQLGQEFTELKGQASGFIQVLPEGIRELKGIRQAINDVNSSKDISSLLKNWQKLREQLSEIKSEGKDLGKILKGSLDGKIIDKLVPSMKQLYVNTKDTASATERLQKLYNNFNPKAMVGGVQAIAASAAGLGNVASIMNQIKSLGESLTNPDLSGWEQLSAVLMGISFIVPQTIAMFNSMGQVQNWLTGTIQKHILTLAASTAATEAAAQAEAAAAIKKKLVTDITDANIINLTEETAAVLANKIAKKANLTVEEAETVIKKALNAAKAKGVTLSGAELLALIAEAGGRKINVEQTKAQVVWQTILNALTGKWGVLVVAVLGLAVTGLIKWIAGMETAEERQKKALETIQKTKQEYEDQSNKVNDLKSELESLGETIDELQSKGPLSLIEEQQLQNSLRQEASLRQQLAYEQEILKVKQQQAIQGWQDNEGEIRSWVTSHEEVLPPQRGVITYSPGIVNAVTGEVISEAKYTREDNADGSPKSQFIQNEEEFDRWIELFIGYMEQERGVPYTEDEKANIYTTYKQQWQSEIDAMRQQASAYFDSYMEYLDGYQMWYESLTDEEKNDPNIQRQMRQYQSYLGDQAYLLYGDEYYRERNAFDDFQKSGSLQATEDFILNNINSDSLDALYAYVSDTFDSEFTDLLNYLGLDPDVFSKYLIDEYQGYNEAVLRAGDPEKINLDTLMAREDWNNEYLALLDDIAIGAGDTLDTIIMKLKDAYNQLPESTSDAEAWGANYATRMGIAKDLETGGSIEESEYNKLGSAYSQYFQKQLDGTYQLIGTAEEFQRIVHETELAALEELPNSINKINQIVEMANGASSSDAGISAGDINRHISSFEQGFLNGDPLTSTEAESWLQGAEGQAVTSILGIDPSQYETTYEAMQLVISGWNQLTESMDVAALSANNLNQLQKMNLTEESFGQGLLHLAALYEDCADEATEYNKAVQQSGENSDDARKAATKLLRAIRAEEWKKVTKACKGFMDSLEDISDPSEIQKVYRDIADTFNETFDTNITEDFVAENIDLFKKWSTASEEEANDIAQEIYYLANLASNVDDVQIDIYANTDDLKTKFADAASLAEYLKAYIEGNPITVDAYGRADLTDLIVDMLDAGATATDLAAALALLGEAEIDTSTWGGGMAASYPGTIEGMLAFINDLSNFRGGFTVNDNGSVNPGANGMADVFGNSRIHGTGGTSGSTYNPPSNSGGGGGSKKHAEQKDSNDRTRYHTIQNQLEDLQAAYDDTSEAADRAFGKDKLRLMDEQGKALDDLIGKQEEYIDALKKDVPVDKAVMDAYYNDVIGGPAMEFDENGNIANYDDIEAAMHAKYNEMASKYTEDSTEWQTFEKQYEQMEKYIEDYEKYYDDLRDAESEYQDLINQRIDLQLQKVQYKIELELDVENDEMEFLEYQLSLIEDDAFKSAEAITLLTKQAESLYDQIQVNKQGLNDTLGLSLSAAEIASVMAGDLSVLDGKTFTEDQISAIRDYRDNLISLNEEFNEVRKSIEEQVMATFDAWREKLEKGSATLQHYGSILASYQNIIDIVGTDTLGISSQFMSDLSQAKVSNSIDQLEAAKSSYEAVAAAQKEAQEALAAAQAAGDEESISMWEETLVTLNEEAQAASEELMAAWEEALSGIVEAFDMAVDRAVQDFNDAIYSLGGVEGLLDAFSNAQETSELMLEDYQQIYELSKLSRDINNSIDDTDNIAGKQKLKKLLGEINKLQEEGVEMSQYDLEYLQAEYQLRLAEIELEEAQNAKNTVRLQKDNEGNWSYVYTQNTDAVDEAQQKYEDALYSMQDLSSNYIDEMSEQLINTSQEMAEALAALRVEDFASIDEYYAEVERVQAEYEEKMALQENELQKAINNNKELYDQDWTNYHNATGYKISDTENFVTSFKDSLLGTLLDTESDTANFTDILGQATASLTTSLLDAAATYYQNLDSAMEAAGTTTESFAEDTKANIEAIVEASTTGAEAIDQMATEMTEAFSAITDSVTSWQETYGIAMQEIIDSNIAVIESFNDMIAALAIDEGSVTVKYDISSAPETDAAQFDTGGYTGTWGNAGKVAVLHEKELILNEDDTSNFLSAIKVTRAMLETIDLNAKQASMGVGNLVPSTVKDEVVQTLEQEVHITAEFPNVSDHNEVEEALKNLMNTASQYANRKS